MNSDHNPEAELAFRFVRDTNKHIFLTGKAGTGKTTFLHRIRKDTAKRSVVVAPTGVAAINARGVTIHSLFQLPFGPLIPGMKRDEGDRRKFTRQKINLLRSLDLLIIDEISMVRADVLDAIDEVLRRYRGNMEPFGGVQLLMIGDLYQLPPVVKAEEWHMLRAHYQTTYFFGSQTLQQTLPVVIELKHIYRQSDEKFISLLNKVRNNQIDEEALALLNSRYQEKESTKDDEGIITLTSHVAYARKINGDRLTQLKGKKHKFTAEVEGVFQPHAFPNDEELEFKIGSQVMFVKNDLSEDKLYYNGKIGKIIDFSNDAITVICEGDDKEIDVTEATWENTKYTLNEKTKVVEEDIVGTFTQYPLRLAWAITIHKSQGLTFDKVIIDASAAFAHGQVYVALSRCRSFEGISLHSKIEKSSISSDQVIQQYQSEAASQAPTESHLVKAQKDFQQYILRQLFDLKGLKTKLEYLYRVIIENSKSLHGTILDDIEEICTYAQTKVINIATKFAGPLEGYFEKDVLPIENTELQQRLSSASKYFITALNDTILTDLKKISIVTDNQSIEKKVKDRVTEAIQEVIVKAACFDSCKVDFDPQRYMTARANAEIDKSAPKSRATTSMKSLRDLEHPLLYKALSEWRSSKAEMLNTEAYNIAPTRALIEISEVLPTSEASLKLIYGIGKARAETIGDEIIDMVTTYCDNENIKGDLIEKASKKEKPKKAEKGSTQMLTLDMYKKGMTIAQIAKEREYAQSTIESHLSQAIAAGELDIYSLMDEKKVAKAQKYFESVEDKSLKLAKSKFGNSYSFGELKMVQSHLKRVKE